MMLIWRVLVVFGALFLAGKTTQAVESAPQRTNLVVILTDNHSPWTLGCYGNREIRTPHIDRLATEGTLFTRCYSSNAVCSPTRATLLTGLIPSQHGVHCYLSQGEPQIGPNAYSTIREFRTLPDILAGAGYVCGLSGKWHLGDNLHPQSGFSYWVTMPHGATSTFDGAQVIENGAIRVEPKYLTDFWTDHGVRFIQQNKDRPFFLYLAYNGPYGLGKSLESASSNRHALYYATQELASFPRQDAHPWLHDNRKYLNDLTAIRRYAAEVSGIDDGVGRIMAALKEHKLEDHTLVVFTADQGLAGGQGGFWGMGDHTRPLTAYDWTMHVPLIYRFPDRVPAGARSESLVSNYDFLPTVLDMLGLAEQVPGQPASPGQSYAAAILGQDFKPRDAVFFEFENVRAIRTNRWKYILRFPEGPQELFDLQSDPGEVKNLINDSSHSASRQDLHKRLTEFFSRYADPKYDLAHGGGSKSRLLSRPAKK